MFTLMIKRQHGNQQPYWYPAYSTDTDIGSDRAAMESMREYWASLPDTRETKIVEAQGTCDEHSEAAERVERYLHPDS